MGETGQGLVSSVASNRTSLVASFCRHHSDIVTLGQTFSLCPVLLITGHRQHGPNDEAKAGVRLAKQTQGIRVSFILLLKAALH